MTAEGDGPMGQAPMSFFAPNPALAVGHSPLAASQELKHVIKQLHAHGIEVILQVSMYGTQDYSTHAVALQMVGVGTTYLPQHGATVTGTCQVVSPRSNLIIILYKMYNGPSDGEHWNRAEGGCKGGKRGGRGGGG